MDVDTILAVVGIIGFAASEIIGLNPKWQSNTVVQVFLILIKKLKK